MRGIAGSVWPTDILNALRSSGGLVPINSSSNNNDDTKLLPKTTTVNLRVRISTLTTPVTMLIVTITVSTKLL